MRNLLCVRRGGLGDTLLMIPVLRAMRARAPAAALTFAGVAEFAGLLTRYGVVDGVRSSEDLGLWGLRAGGEALGRARRRLAAFDWILGDDQALTELAGGDRRVDVFDPVLRSASTEPAATQLLARVGLSGSDEVALVHARATPSPDAPVILHVGSGSLTKCWPRAALQALAAALAAVVPLRLVLGPAEVERGEATGWPSGVELSAPVDVEALAAMVASARAYVGHDSGPTHLAAALRVPTLALFVSTEPRVWAPVGEHVQVICDEPTPATIDRVVALTARA